MVDGFDETGDDRGGERRAARTYSASYKQRILEELDAATEPGQPTTGGAKYKGYGP